MTTAPTPITAAATAAATAAPRARARHVAASVATSVVAFVMGIGLVGFAAPPAQAASYRYWTYWSGDSGSWAFSSIGAARRPPNGGVEGWRFEVSPAAASSQPPRTAASFASICGTTAPGVGNKRVALVIDYGTAADAPPGQQPPAATIATCVEVDAAATGYDVLASQASIRAQSGLVCGIGGYPATGCGEAAADPTPSASPSRSNNGGGSADGSGASTSSSGSSGNAASAAGTGTNAAGDSTSKRHPTPSASAAVPGEPGPVPASSDSATPVAATTSDASGGSPVGVAVGIGVIAVLAAGAWFATRARRAS